jgi:glycosyltransferase involved in cell wall biosynthesis
MDQERSPQAKLLFLEALPTISGGQAVLVGLASQLHTNFDLSVLLPGEGPLAEALRALGMHCIFAPIGRYSLLRKTPADMLNYAIRLPWLIFFTWRLIRRDCVDLVYANSARTFIWGTLAAALADRPILWHHHSLLTGRETLALLRFLGRWRTVRRIIAVSEAAAAQFHTLKAKVAIISTGVDTDLFRPDPAARTRIRSELGIPCEAFTVGMVGDLIPLKGQRTLLEAARMDSSGARYLVVGSARPGDDESNTYAVHLRQMAGDNIIFIGRRDDLPAVLNALDLLVVASTTETGPLVLLEALACGVPAVSTPVGRAPELLPPEALFPIGDATALLDRLRFWSADSQKLERAKSAARTLAEEQLQLEQFQLRVRAEVERALSHAA